MLMRRVLKSLDWQGRTGEVDSGQLKAAKTVDADADPELGL